MNAIWLGRTLVFAGLGVALGIATSWLFGVPSWWPVAVWVIVMLLTLDVITAAVNRRADRRDDESPPSGLTE